MNQLGYKALQTYYSPKLWKTDAPPEVIYDIVKSYKHKMYKGDKAQILANLKEGTPGYRIIEKPLSIQTEIKFGVREAKEKNPAEMKKLLGKREK